MLFENTVCHSDIHLSRCGCGELCLPSKDQQAARGLDNNIHEVHFNYQDIRDAIDELSPNASAGPDGIPAILLKKCRDVLSQPLEILWKKSMENGEIPEIFKLAHVCPLLKPGSHRSSPVSYRPVSLTSHLVKTFERVVKKSFRS